MVRSCSAYNCSNRNLPGGTLAFHQFPLQDSARLKKWLKNMRREHFYPSRTTYLCSEHFEEKCYWKGHKKKLLNDDAVPTIFNFSEHHFKKTRQKKLKKVLKPKVKKLLTTEMLQKNTTDKMIDLDDALEIPSIKKSKNKQGQSVDKSNKSVLTKRMNSNSDKRKSKRSVKVLKTDIDSDDQMFEQCLINEDNGDIFILNDVNETVEGVSTSNESRESVQLGKYECETNFKLMDKKCDKNVHYVNNESVKNGQLESKQCENKNKDNYCEQIGPSIINKYAKGDHTYVKNFSDQIEEINLLQSNRRNEILQATDGTNISPENIFEAMGESEIPDANVLEAIHEMGKSSAVIILVKEELLNPSQAVRKKTKSNILQGVNPGDSREIGEIEANVIQMNDEIIKQIRAYGHDKSISTICKITPEGDQTNTDALKVKEKFDARLQEADKSIFRRKGRKKKTYTDVFKVKEEFRNIDTRLQETDESIFRLKDKREKSSADIIKIMQTDHLMLTNKMLHVVNTQRKEIDNLKILLNSERMKTKMLCNIEGK